MPFVLCFHKFNYVIKNATGNLIDDLSKPTVYHVMRKQPKSGSGRHIASHVTINAPGKHKGRTEFMSFKKNGKELGNLSHDGARFTGIALESSAGDFAEWCVPSHHVTLTANKAPHTVIVSFSLAPHLLRDRHERKASVDAFELGDVVGFHQGKLTRRTTNCQMVGIISRQAIVKGSMPPAHCKHAFDTVSLDCCLCHRVAYRRPRGCEHTVSC